MKEFWSLDVLYLGYEDEKFQRDMNYLNLATKEMNAVAAQLDYNHIQETLRTIVSCLEKVMSLAERLMIFCSLKQSTNTSDTESVSYLGQINQALSNSAKADAIFKKYIAGIRDLETIIEEDALLKDYRFMLLQIKENAKYLLGDDVEEVISKFNISGGHAWEELQGFLTSSVKVDYEGEQITLAAVRNLAYSNDPLIRKKAYDAEIASYDKVKDAIAYSLNSIKLQVLTEAGLRGYESPIDMTLHKSFMKRETLDALFTAINEYLPKFHAYLRRKGEMFGSKTGIAWWDLFAPVGNSERKFTVEEARDYLLTHFQGFAPDLAEMVKMAFDEEWIDFFPRDGKVGGAFCCNLQGVKQSRVLTNFDGTLNSVRTLAHELGHAYHNHLIHSHRILNAEYSMPVAETASIFNEAVITNAAMKDAAGEERLMLIESELQDVTQIICDIYSRYLFESAVFEKRKSSFMFAGELKEMMLSAQKTAFGDGVNETTLHPYMWACKSHYYSSQVSFYNFPYAFGGLFSRGLYAQYKKEGTEFLPKYRELLHATTVCTVEEAAGYAGIDLSKPDFWRVGLSEINKQIDEFLELTKERI